MTTSYRFAGSWMTLVLMTAAVSTRAQAPLQKPALAPAPVPAAVGAPGPAIAATPGSPGIPGAPGSGPRIQFAETRFDFGKIKATQPVRHEYIFTNTGKATLEITGVQPGCPGCTKALPWDRTVEPGQTGRIPIEFNPTGFSGTLTKSATVTCNDPQQPTHVLSFQANIWQPIDVQPAYVYFLPVEGESTNETKIVRITSNLEEPLTLRAPHSDNPIFDFVLKTNQPGREYALHITLAHPVTNAAPPSLVNIETSSTNAPLVKVTVGVMPQPSLVVSPPMIQFPALRTPPANTPAPAPAPTGHRHTQMIRNNSSTPMKVTEATVNAEGVTVQVNESQPGKLFLLTVSFPPGFEVSRTDSLALTVKTSHPRRPIITVPITPAPAPGSFGRPYTPIQPPAK